MSLTFRGYDPRDADAVVALDDWAMRAAGTDPTDIPGHGDIERIGSAYLDAGGEFLVGTLDTADRSFDTADRNRGRFETFDGPLAAMGGYLPNEAGYDDERTVEDAAELHRMRVAPSVQGRGYGTDLLDALEERMAEAGFSRVLATTARRQERAIALYPGAGYEQVDSSTYGEYDLVHFQKRLPPAEDE
ncbi:MAG: acetyltransferase (GNAT) family [halophilic archaeon J07HX64]|jgi:Acetyltransferase (GNAT) family.|nr:MAG: acetyltransferase (GNAT) family [halophilic archaeon J07HX64]